MPIYEYVCSDCGAKFELLRRLSESDEDADCPRCQRPARKVMSSFACFSTSDGGSVTPLGGNDCGSCSASSCDTCAS